MYFTSYGAFDIALGNLLKIILLIYKNLIPQVHFFKNKNYIINIATRWDPYDSYPHDSDLFILFGVCNNSLKGSSYIIYPILYTLIY